MENYDKDLWQKCINFHGHSCPGLVMGFQASRLVQDKFNIKFSQDEELVCVCENDACGVDAIQVITGCTFGKGNLIYRPTGKQAYSFYARTSGQNVRLILNRPNNLPEDKAQATRQLLHKEPEELFTQKSPHYQLPDQAKIFETIKCEKCGEGAAEYAIRLQEGKNVCLDCFDNYSRQLDSDLR